MKRLVRYGLWVFVMGFTFTLPTFAQKKWGRSEQIESIKVAFITSKLDLTTEEAQKFWPVYNNYTTEFLELLKKRREARYNKNSDPNETISADILYESKMLELKKKYRKLYAKAIPPQKILALYRAESEFREHLYKQLNNRRKAVD
ncbi:hypothetical protein [Daejeonella lutea]|uniref:Sensor of ECF-type sigma factor n=1 Tax=Daejeonella lutea TaxID=572036 RepID=A0A1T4ZZR9_9SPHI|nr:hypothetical protein [Daejeonella lutea]SKB28281.1 hypothetical protein SAMN05661099_0154 [Daejeonella lutea]